jgi:segregation and condensation protein B
MDDSERRRIVEAVILGAPEPISAQRVAAVIPYCKPEKVKALVEDLNAEYAELGRSFEIGRVAGGYQVRTLPEFATYLQQIQPQRPLRLSKAALETLAIVAYRQPVTRAEIEDVRGVDAGAVVRGLLDRKLIRIAGHKEVPGRPMLFGTTRRFLEVFGLEKLEDLPSLRQLEALAPREVMGAGDTDGEGVDTGAHGGPDRELEASAEVPTGFFDDAEPVGKLH